MLPRPSRLLRVTRWTIVSAFLAVLAAAILSEFRVLHASERYDRPWPSQALLERSTLSCWIYTLRPGAPTDVEHDGLHKDHGFLITRPVTPTKSGRYWLPQLTIHTFDTAWFVGFRLPLWCPLVLLAIPVTGMLWRGPFARWNRTRRGLCPRCGYDVRGASVCPECGFRRPVLR